MRELALLLSFGDRTALDRVSGGRNASVEVAVGGGGMS